MTSHDGVDGPNFVYRFFKFNQKMPKSQKRMVASLNYAEAKQMSKFLNRLNLAANLKIEVFCPRCKINLTNQVNLFKMGAFNSPI